MEWLDPDTVVLMAFFFAGWIGGEIRAHRRVLKKIREKLG